MKISKGKILMGCLIALCLGLCACNFSGFDTEDGDCSINDDCPPPPPSEPQPVTVEVGSTALFFVYSSTGDAYQWYVGKSKEIAGSNFTAIPGATKDTLKVFDAQLSQDSSYVYCAEKSGGLITNEGPVLLRVIPDST